jgi:phage terminase small subunit
MTPKQKRFIAEYRALRNASEAARRAGYSEGRGRLLLRRPHVIAALKRAGVEIVYGINPPGQERAPRRPYERRMLTALQQRFVEEYLVDGNATKAAMRAGLRGRDPSSAGSKMLRGRMVTQAIERERERSMERIRISRDRVLTEYARVAFAEIGDIADWDEDGMRLKPKRAIGKHDRAAVLELSARNGQDGAATRIRMHSKMKALDALAKHLGLWGGKRGPGTVDADGQWLINGRDAREALRERFKRLVQREAESIAAAAKEAEEKKKEEEEEEEEEEKKETAD